ncbi:hypothetical protein SLEP1_g6111 [Rubroshorea leprosula]|uniref:Uncharacterized protein n=1 Tax=Rubroshorea leprosula TaxID=152421 RepID=A0AAV5I403_9ROSI|nr:hypothetical protein SLEP1_g6111 [Rubroshorea leprosula]
MGKQGPPRSPRPKYQNSNIAFGVKDYQVRCSDSLQGSDPSIGRRILGGGSDWNSKVLLLRGLKNDCGKISPTTGKSGWHKEVTPAYINEDRPPVQMYGRLLSLASSSLVDNHIAKKMGKKEEEEN